MGTFTNRTLPPTDHFIVQHCEGLLYELRDSEPLHVVTRVLWSSSRNRVREVDLSEAVNLVWKA